MLIKWKECFYQIVTSDLYKGSVFWYAEFYGIIERELGIGGFWFYNRHDWQSLWENWQVNVNGISINLWEVSYVIGNLFLNECKYTLLGMKQGAFDNFSVHTEM